MGVSIAKGETAASLLFERLPDPLFGPLASPNRRSYWAVLCALHKRLFGPDAPLPPSHGFANREITQLIEDELLLQDLWELEEGESYDTPMTIRAIGVFNRLRDAGWLRQERHGIDKRVTMTPVVSQFLSQLIMFAETGPVYVAGKIRSIEANLKLVMADDGGDSLHEAAEQARNLLEHVRNAGTNLRDLMSELAQEQTTAEYVRRFFGDFIERMFIGDYKELRTREHPLSRSPQILRWVEELHESEAHRRRLLVWYKTKRFPNDQDRAVRMFERDIQRLLDIRRIDEYLDRLDDEIRRANRRALAFLDYQLRSVRPIDQLVDAAVVSVLACPGDPEGTPFPPGDLVSPIRLAEPRGQETREKAGALREHVVSDEEIARSRLKLKARHARTISAPKLAEFVTYQLAGQLSVPSDAMQLKTISDVCAYQKLSSLGTAISSGSYQLRTIAAAMARGFTVKKEGNTEEPGPMLSGVPFTVELLSGTAQRKGEPL